MDDTLRERAAAWYYRDHFGLAKPPPAMEYRAMAIALVSVAGSDREISIPERNWIVGYFATKGYPAEAVRAAMAANASDITKLGKLVDNDELRMNSRMLVYDAIRVASQEGYSATEEKAVREVAFSIGLDEAAVRDIEALVRDEEQARLRRIRVLFPDGHPNLDPRYAAGQREMP
jgi:hypothetical protein